MLKCLFIMIFIFPDTADAPKWRCFLKYITPRHFFITLIPASFCDLKRLIVNRENILDSSNKSVQIIDEVDCLELLKEQSSVGGVIPSDITEEDVSFSTTFSERTSTSSPVTQRAKSISSSCQLQRFASTSSNLSSRSSSIAYDRKSVTPKQANYNNLNEKKISAKLSSDAQQHSSVNDSIKKADELKRQRYKSGPSASTLIQPSLEAFDESLEPRRGRAFSLHSSADGSSSQKPSRSSMSALSSAEKNSSICNKERKEMWTSPEGEKLRRRNVSLPSKCHADMTGNRGFNSKSFSVEMMKEDASGIGSQIALYGDAETSFHSSSIESAFQQPDHDPVYGSVVLPIYCFDCRLGHIVDHYLSA